MTVDGTAKKREGSLAIRPTTQDFAKVISGILLALPLTHTFERITPGLQIAMKPEINKYHMNRIIFPTIISFMAH